MTQKILASLLNDLQTFAGYITEDTADVTFDEYEANRHVRQVLERNLIVIGITAARIRDKYPETYNQIPSLRGAINIRNRLAHGYEEDIDNVTMWSVARKSIPVLLEELAALDWQDK